MSDIAKQSTSLPRIAITYCTQCRWMLRAAYFAQELLTTFGTSIGEIALIPATGGRFTVYLTYDPIVPEGTDDRGKEILPREVLLWDYSTKKSFPETKILKQLVRNHIDPERSLGHSDKPSKITTPSDVAQASPGSVAKPEAPSQQACEDCK